MARLPQPGGDSGNWGDILNDYLATSHKSDGTIKDNSIGSAQLQDNAVTAAALAPNSVTSAALASDSVTAATIADGSITESLLASAVQTKLNAPATIADGSVTNTKIAVDSVAKSQLQPVLRDELDAKLTKAVGDSSYAPQSLADETVKSVNGALPDEVGNVDVEGGGLTEQEAAELIVSPKLRAQPARRLFDKALTEIATRSLNIPMLTASTGEGSVADVDKSVHILLQKMFQSSYNPPGISGGYSLKVRAWPKTGSTGEVLDVDTKKLAVLNSGATATHTTRTPSTGIDIMYPSGPGYAAFTVAIDGGAPVTVTPGSTEAYNGVWRSPVLTRAVHTYVITSLGDGAALGLAYIRDQDEKAGVRLLNFGRAGGATTEFVSTVGESTMQRLDAIVPDGAILMLGHNNMPNSVTQMKADLGVLCDRIQSAAGRPVWIALTIQHSTDVRWPAYATALAEFAATRPTTVTVHSFREYFADNVTDAAASGEYFTDNLHLNNLGHAIASDVLADSMGLPSRRKWAEAPATEGQPSVEPGSPDVTSGLMQEFTFDLGLAEGASVGTVAPTAGTRALSLTEPTTARQPTYLTNFANGRGGLKFTRANSQLLRTPLFGAENNNAMPATLVVVGKRATAAAAAGMFVHGGVFNSLSTGLAIESEATTFRVRMNSVNGGNLAGGAVPDTDIHIMIAVFDGASSRFHVDGDTYTGTITDGAQNVLPRLTVGSNLAGTANFLDGEIGFIREYDRALSTTEAEYLRQQLRTRFALTA